MKSNLEIIQYLEEFITELEESKATYKEILDEDPDCEHTTELMDSAKNDLFTINQVLKFAKSS